MSCPSWSRSPDRGACQVFAICLDFTSLMGINSSASAGSTYNSATLAYKSNFPASHSTSVRLRIRRTAINPANNGRNNFLAFTMFGCGANRINMLNGDEVGKRRYHRGWQIAGKLLVQPWSPGGNQREREHLQDQFTNKITVGLKME